MSIAPSTEDNPATRLVSLDVLRGFEMFWIVGGDFLVRSLPAIHDSATTRELATPSDLMTSLVRLALIFWLVNFLYRRKIFLRL